MILSDNPFIAYTNCFLPNEMLTSLLDVDNFSPSALYSPTTNLVQTVAGHRKSNTAMLDKSFDNVSKYLLDFIYKTYGHNYNLDQAEGLQVTQYDAGGEHKNHVDYLYEFDTSHYRKIMPNAKHLSVKKDRIATIILYLNEDFEGGTTDFPKLKINVKPVTGHILYFTYPKKNEAAANTLHSGAVVTKGSKKILTLWIRE